MKKFYKEVLKECKEVEQEIIRRYDVTEEITEEVIKRMKSRLTYRKWFTIITVALTGIIIGGIIGVFFNEDIINIGKILLKNLNLIWK
jgi:ABC-type siderophore export system fused ATPase/permease subunit